MMDLSKFLTPSDDDENENEEKLYDTVENVRQQVEEHLKKEQDPNIPSTSAQIDADPETESWDDDEDDDLLPLPDEGGFQLEFISISRVINHMTCYKLSALIG